MNSVISFRGRPISTSSHGHVGSIRILNPDIRSDGRNHSRRYDCEDYLDCLFRASVVNASKLPCKGCTNYSPRYAGEEPKNATLWV